MAESQVRRLASRRILLDRSHHTSMLAAESEWCSSLFAGSFGLAALRPGEAAKE